MLNPFKTRHDITRAKHHNRRRNVCLYKAVARYMLPSVALAMAGVLINYQSFLDLETTSTSIILPRKLQVRETPQTVFLDGKSNVRPSQPRVLEEDMWLSARYTRHRYSTPVNITDGAVPLRGRNGNCVATVPRFYPTCNSFHELGFQLGTPHNDTESIHGNERVSMEFLGSGKSRDAWKVIENENAVVLKTLKVDGVFSHLTYHFQTVDSIASERLSASRYVIDIFGFCGVSVINEIGVAHRVKEQLTLSEKLRYSRDIAGGMADLHEIGGGFPKIVHGDLRRGNVMFSQDRKTLKISDFNLGFFLGWDTASNRTCGHKRENELRARQRDKFSSPEETFGEVLTEASDVYHLGGMLFYLLNGGKPFIYNDSDDMDDEGNPKIKAQWTLPTLSKRLRESDDPTVMSMWRIILACLRYKAKRRPTAREIFNRISKIINEVKLES